MNDCAEEKEEQIELKKRTDYMVVRDGVIHKPESVQKAKMRTRETYDSCPEMEAWLSEATNTCAECWRDDKVSFNPLYLFIGMRKGIDT